MKIKLFRTSVIALGIFTVVGIVSVAEANHSWSGYHWARATHPLSLKLGDNVSSAWDGYLATTSAMWSLSSVLDTTIINGGKDPRKCQSTLGRVDVCNSKYGRNGWLGIASVWINGDHITKGTVKLNDTYFTMAAYNTPAWRNLVMCQEIGHTFGLDHQDEVFNNANLGTCMDYTNDPSGLIYGQLSNEFPNQHDYDQLETIYAHLDAINTTGQTVVPTRGFELNTEDQKEWGEKIRTSKDGKGSLYERRLGNGEKIFTFVIWAK